MSYLISHPDVEGTAVIPERALDTHAANGWVIADRVTDGEAVALAPRMKQPNRSDSAAKWKTYAVVSGMPYETAMSKTRDELAEHYQPTPKPDSKTPAKGSDTNKES